MFELNFGMIGVFVFKDMSRNTCSNGNDCMKWQK